MSNYSNKYSKNKFWNKIKKFAFDAGKKTVKIALSLFYCLNDPDTPAWAKTFIIGALGYFIFPADIIPDLTPPPPTGYADDVAIMLQVIKIIGDNLKKEHIKEAEKTTNNIFRNI
jgi:uncharacterized membrane protein YkvA (DUF1232 family)